MSSFEKLVSIISENRSARALPDLTRARNTKGSLKFMAIMTLSNFHLTVSELYRSEGDDSKAKYHLDLANRMRTEANAARAEK